MPDADAMPWRCETCGRLNGCYAPKCVCGQWPPPPASEMSIDPATARLLPDTLGGSLTNLVDSDCHEFTVEMPPQDDD